MDVFLRQFLFVLATAMIGLCSGLAAAAFQTFSFWIFQSGLQAAAELPFWIFAAAALFISTGGALIAGKLMEKFAQDAPGSGIPQVKAAYSSGRFDFSWNLLWVKFFAGALTIGTGSSLGREGPTIHIGAAIASKIAAFAKEQKAARANAICAGSAAGLAAAFSSPLAGVTLVLEEIAEGRDLDKYAGRCLLASAISVTMIYFITGNAAALPINGELPLKWEALWLSPLAAIFAAMSGIFFQWATLSLRKAFKSSKLPLWLRPAAGAAIAAVCCIAAFALTDRLGAFGLGTADLRSALDNKIVWQAAAYLLAAKLLATIFCYGSGGCGGIFAPLIFFGAMAGSVVFGFAQNWIDLDAADQTALSLIGMTAALGAVVRAPLTSIIIVIEMTRQIHVLPALMIAAVIGVFINTLFFRSNFYNASIEDDKNTIDLLRN